MAPPRRTDTEAYLRGSALAAEVRGVVADQLRELVLEGDRAGSGGAVKQRIERIVTLQSDILSAQGRQEQHREMGLPLAPPVRDEIEAKDALRSAVMMLGVAAGEWVASLDFEKRKGELTLTNGSAKRRRKDEETI